MFPIIVSKKLDRNIFFYLITGLQCPRASCLLIWFQSNYSPLLSKVDYITPSVPQAWTKSLHFSFIVVLWCWWRTRSVVAGTFTFPPSTFIYLTFRQFPGICNSTPVSAEGNSTLCLPLARCTWLNQLLQLRDRFVNDSYVCHYNTKIVFPFQINKVIYFHN